ncbi:MAG: hypothetical protein V4750_17545 [Pseudomonadota bacterium]
MSITLKAAGKATVTTLAIACAALALVTSAQAQSHGGRGGGHSAHGGGSGWHGGGGHYAPRYGGGNYRRGGNGWVWGGVGLGLGLGLASYYNSYPYYYNDPGYVVVDPPVVYGAPRTVYSQPVPARGYQSDVQPVIYPRNGQSAAALDADANACSEWAGQQPNATRDPSVFMRSTQACMDARGYTVR